MLPTYGLSMREWYCLSVFAPVRPVGSSNGSASRPTAPTPVPTGRIAEMGDPDSYAANAAARWSGVGASIAAPDGVLGVTTPTETRYLVCRRLASASVAELVASVPGSVTAGGRLVVEDPYGAKLEPTGVAVRVLRMPVMCRLSQPVTPVSPQGVTVTAVTGPDDLAAAEQVIVDGFPQPHAQPRVVGQTLPPHVLDIARVLRPRTEELYRSLLQNHLMPFFGNWRLDAIREADVRHWRKQRLLAGPGAVPPFGPVTVAKAYRLLRAIFTTAVDDGLIKRNPCRIKGAGQEHSPERLIVPLPELMRLFDAIPSAIGRCCCLRRLRACALASWRRCAGVTSTWTRGPSRYSDLWHR